MIAILNGFGPHVHFIFGPNQTCEVELGIGPILFHVASMALDLETKVMTTRLLLTIKSTFIPLLQENALCLILQPKKNESRKPRQKIAVVLEV